MKKFLLAFLLLGTAFVGKSQILLNEFYPSPNLSTENEFFELVNTGSGNVNLSCYTIVVYIPAKYFDNNSKAGFYVMTLPSYNLGSNEIFTAAASSPLNVVGQPTNTPNLNWNNFSSGVTLKQYTTSGSSYTINNLTSGNTKLLDFLTGSYSYFLFDNTGKYINGFLGNSSTTNVSNAIKTMNKMTISNTGCTSYTIDWSTITTAESTTASAGNTSNGYARQGAGVCGIWAKTANSPAPSPGLSNPIDSKNTSPYTNKITAAEAITCNSTKVVYKVSSTSDATIFPITVDLFYDRNGDGSGDISEYQSTSAPINASPLPYYGSFNITEANPLLVYRTKQGCITRVSLPTAANFNVTTTQSNLCDKWVNFSISAMSADLATFGQISTMPLTVEVHYDLDDDGQIDPGSEETVQASKSVSAVPTTGVQDITIPDPGNKIVLVYTSSNPDLCFSQAVKAPYSSTGGIVVNGSISNTYDANKKRTLTYNVVNSATSPNAYPLTIQAFEDKDRSLSLTGSELTPIDQHTISTAPASGASDTKYTVLISANSFVVIKATSTDGCPSITFNVDNTNTILPVHFASFTASRKDDSKVSLKWTTASEQNNKGFYVQRSVGGSPWKDVAFVFSQAEGGNSTQELSYSFTDMNGAKEISQYRILQVDLDGKGRYSEVRSVRGTGAVGAGLLLFPNPSTSGTVNLLFGSEGARTIVVSDVSGRVVQQHRGITGSSYTLSNLITGYYSVQVVEQDGRATTQKVLVTKR